MKIKRHKHTKRVLKFFKTNYNYDISKQVNVLVDGTFAHEALNCKINLADQMPKFFDLKPKNCRLLTTKCAVKETELLGKPTHGAMLILKQYEQVECQHKREYVNAEKCIKTIIARQADSIANPAAAGDKREQKYFIATQSESLKNAVRTSKGVPLVVISHNAINLEKPSEASFEHVTQKTESKLQPKVDDLRVIKKLKEKLGVGQKSQEKHLHRRRKVKGPNPLSCLRKKKQQKNGQSKAQ